MKFYTKFIFLFFIIMLFASCSSKNQGSGSLNCVLQPDSCSDKLASNSEALRIQVLGLNPLIIPVTQTSLKLVGLCNEGAYPDNYIQWKIKLNEDIILNSEDSLNNSQCVNGKFNLSIDISSSVIVRETKANAEDTSLTSYKMELFIVGFDYNAQTAISTELVHSLEFQKSDIIISD